MRSVKAIPFVLVLAAMIGAVSVAVTGVSNAATSSDRISGTIRNAGNGFCLDIKTYNVGEPVILWPCHGGTSQQWRSQSDGTIRNAGNGFCLDIKTYNVGEPVILWPCHGGTSQQWRH